MKDRVPGAPGQYKAVVTETELQKMRNGEEFTITMTRDDNPLEEGTPYSKAAVLPDELAAHLCPYVADPTPADAFWALLPKSGGTMAGDIAMGGHKVTGLGTPVVSGDAVPIGYALGAFAPAGYGLGTAAKNISQDLDTVVENGWYCYNAGTCANAPVNKASLLHVENFYNTDYCKQTVTTLSVNYEIITRIRIGGVWQPWEYVNPPMVFGMEYRTTERWKEKPVYTCFFSLGSVPDSSYKVTQIPLSGTRDEVIDVRGWMSDGTHVFSTNTSGDNAVTIYAMDSGVVVECVSGAVTHYSAFCVVKYTKK